MNSITRVIRNPVTVPRRSASCIRTPCMVSSKDCLPSSRKLSYYSKRLNVHSLNEQSAHAVWLASLHARVTTLSVHVHLRVLNRQDQLLDHLTQLTVYPNNTQGLFSMPFFMLSFLASSCVVSWPTSLSCLVMARTGGLKTSISAPAAAC